MVNVGGRSKGCSTCRRRRVKCDETRPVCKRCQKGGFDCSGARDITFVEANIVRSRRTDHRTILLQKCDSDNDTNPPPDSRVALVPLSPPIKGNEFERCICYARKYLRHGGPLDAALQNTQLSDIIVAGTSSANGQLFPLAVLSFAVLLFGTKHRQPSISGPGYAIQGLALKRLHQALSEPTCYARDDVMLSVISLSMSECWVPTGPKHYLQHMIGLERLIELRGPSSYTSAKSLKLYKASRHMVLFASLSTRRPSILARPEWKRLLRTNCSKDEMQEQNFFDALADCTVLTAESDGLLQHWGLDSSRDIHQRDDIKSRSLALLASLFDWRKQCSADRRYSYVESAALLATLNAAQDALSDASLPFRTVFDFPNDMAATMLMVYNTTLIYILQVLASLPLDDLAVQPNQNLTPNTIPEQQDPRWTYTREDYITAQRIAALHVCRSTPYLALRVSEADPHLSPIVYWAASIAWKTLGGNTSPEGRWMMQVLTAKGQDLVVEALWTT